jgi:hypothetical protein
MRARFVHHLSDGLLISLAPIDIKSVVVLREPLINARHTHFASKRTQAVVADLANSPAIDGDPRLGLHALEHKLHAPCIYQRFLIFFN